MEKQKIRVLIANPTRVLRDSLYDAIRKEPGIEVVGDVSDESVIVSAAERTNADCVIIPLGDSDRPAPTWTEILAKRPHMRIVAIGEGTNIAALYWRSENGDVRCTYTTASRKSILRALSFPVS